MNAPARLTPKAYKSAIKPVWCPGCGDYAVLSAITKALAELQLPPEQVAVISGIGCSSRIPAYLGTYGFHGVHGRALPLATGLKLSRPDLTVLVTGGDGDGFSIGGNHFLHACRRNVNLTYIVMDNQVYGMTKGQASPTTEADWLNSKLTPEGPGVNPFHPLVVALSAGADFIARANSSDTNGTAKIIAEAIQHPGFAFVQVLSPCVTYRPEQRAWKQISKTNTLAPTRDPGEAARRLLQDDHLTTGVLYVGHRPVFQTPKHSGTTVASLEQEFLL